MEVQRQAEFPGSDFGPWQDSLVDKIGYRIQQVIEELGAPKEISVQRGTEAFQDTVVFYYPDHSYLYLWQDRIWQIRIDKRHRGPILGLEMNISREEALRRLGTPYAANDTLVRYRLPERGWPIELLLYFTAGKLDDLYLRRADF